MIPSTMMWATWMPFGPNSRARDWVRPLRANIPGAIAEKAAPPPVCLISVGLWSNSDVERGGILMAGIWGYHEV